jgi:hypothetical protein
VVHYGVRERAAMGMIFENPPFPFLHRVVVPVAIGAGTAPQCAWLAHLPNNYADNPIYPHAKIAMMALFAGSFDAKREVTLASFQSTPQKILRSVHRVSRNVGAMCRGFRIISFDGLRRVKRRLCGPGDRRGNN